jgi:hypothetical protein
MFAFLKYAQWSQDLLTCERSCDSSALLERQGADNGKEGAGVHDCTTRFIQFEGLMEWLVSLWALCFLSPSRRG